MSLKTMQPLSVFARWSASALVWSTLGVWLVFGVVSVLFGWHGDRLLLSIPVLVVVGLLRALQKVEVHIDRVVVRSPWGSTEYPLDALRGVSVAAVSWSNHDSEASRVHVTATWEKRLPLRLRSLPLRTVQPLIELHNGALVTAYERRMAQGEAVVVPLDRCHVSGAGHFAGVALATEGFRLLPRDALKAQAALKAAPFRTARGEAEGFTPYRAIVGWFDRGSHWLLHLRHAHGDATMALAGGETTVLMTLLARRLQPVDARAGVEP